MRFSIIASMLVIFAVASTTVQAAPREDARECENYASGCKACVCNQWADTSKCCYGEFNGGNGNCEGLKAANTDRFQACCNSKGQVTVNGVALTEGSYLYPGNQPSAQPFNITVPPGRLWVMGDHRAVSYDSRGHMGDPGGGTIPESEVVGRAFMIVWPPSRWRILPIPATFGQPGVTSGKPAAAGRSAAASRSAAESLSEPAMIARPAAPYLPLEIGFAGAVPITWLRRRSRLRVRGRRQRQGSR